MSSDEAARCLKRFGPNDLVPAQKTPSIWSWIVKLGSDPMALLLIATALTYLVVGDRVDAIVVSVALVPIFLVSAVLEIRADTAIDRLRDAVAPRARVRRDGTEVTIAGRDVVPGDIMVVSEGDVLVADGCLLPGGHITCDESTLTGESIPVDKSAAEQDPIASELFAGTTVAAGTALARVTATGRATQYGRIGGLLADLTAPPTPIERSIRRLILNVTVQSHSRWVRKSTRPDTIFRQQLCGAYWLSTERFVSSPPRRRRDHYRTRLESGSVAASCLRSAVHHIPLLRRSS